MQRVTKLVVVIVTMGLATAMFAGAASAGTTLSKKAYLKQGNAICKSANKDINAIFEEFFKDFEQNQVPTAEQQQQVLDQVIPIFTQSLDELEALDGPADLDAKVDKLIADYRAVITQIQADPSVVFSDDQNAPDPFAKPNKQAKKLGLKACAQG